MLKKFLIAEKKKSTFDINKQNSMCSKKMFNLLDKGIKTFCNKNNIYLEIGVYLGATLTVLAENNPKIKCIGVDDFSFFNKNKKNYSIVKKIIKDKKLNNTFVLNKDFEDAFTFLKKKNIKVGIIFVDGSHDYRSTLITLLKYYNLLTKNSLIVIDDSNYYHVRKANDDFLNTHKDCHLVFQKYTKTHISNLSNKKKIQAFNGYWNGWLCPYVLRHEHERIYNWFAEETPEPQSLEEIEAYRNAKPNEHGLYYWGACYTWEEYKEVLNDNTNLL